MTTKIPDHREIFWKCPGCARIRTQKGFWLNQSEICRCGWPISDYQQASPNESAAIAAQRAERKEMGL